MMSTKVSVDKTRDVPEKTIQGIRQGMMAAANRGFTKSQEEVPKDRGTLLQSGAPPMWQGDTLVWGYQADYARHVEEGTRPHWPPIDPLKGWARRVLGDESAAYAVQRKIAAKGTPAQPYVEPGVEEMIRELRNRGLSPAIDEEL